MRERKGGGGKDRQLLPAPTPRLNGTARLVRSNTSLSSFTWNGFWSKRAWTCPTYLAPKCICGECKALNVSLLFKTESGCFLPHHKLNPS